MEEASLTTKLRRDSAFRSKFIRTLCILSSYITLGYFYGNLGPALPDLQLLTGQSLDIMSWLFTATYAGSFIGTLVCGPVCDRVGPQLVLFVSVFMASCLTGIFIFSPNLTVMIIVRVLTGIFIGGVDLGGIASVADLWRAEARPYMHALQFMISIGGIISPFIMEPFLAQRADGFGNIYGPNNSLTDTGYNATDSLRLPVNKSFDLGNFSSFPVLPDRSECNETSAGSLETNLTKISVIGKTRIHYAFIVFTVTGVFASISVLGSVIYECRMKQNPKTRTTVKESDMSCRTQYKMSRTLKLALLGITAIQSYLSAALGLKVYALLPSFFVIQFRWSTSKASVATSGFWIGKAVSRFAGIILSTKIKQSQLIPLFSTIYVISSVCLTISAVNRIDILAWIVTVTMGVGLSILRSCLFTVTEEKITHVTGKVASLYLVFFVFGGMLDPLYTGYLMDDFSPMWFTYLLVFESSLFLVLFILLKVLLKFGQEQDIRLETEIKPIHE